jgi:peptide/nickel transport system substrate-binding protein
MFLRLFLRMCAAALGLWLGAACLAGAAQAQTLRWAGRGDIGTLDPHSFNEGLTDSVLGHVYEQLARRNRQQQIEPALAESWQVVNDTTWRFTMRAGVKFSDGTPLTAADAVFSIERAQQANSQQAFFARQLGKPVLLDERRFELRLEKPNPLLLEHQQNVRIMSAAWCRANKSEQVPNFTNKEEAPSTRRAMGTGPFVIERFEPGVRVTMARNPGWWDRFEGNVERVVYTPIANDSTRTAALLAGDIDLTHDTPPQDIARLGREGAVKLLQGPENRVLFFVLDQGRDELLHSNVKGKNPFKDMRVREAFALAIDAEAIKAATMRGQSVPTGCMATSAVGCLAPELEQRPLPDAARAKRLLAEAGYPQGFEVALDCPNDRYVNDQAICVAVAGMLGRAGVKVRVEARTKTLFFQKIERLDTSFYLLGWGGGTTDAQGLLDPIVRRHDARTQKGGYNYGRIGDEATDALIDAAGVEMNTTKRADFIARAQRRVREQHLLLPLHRQMITWAARRNVSAVVMPDAAVRVHWVRLE